MIVTAADEGLPIAAPLAPLKLTVNASLPSDTLSLTIGTSKNLSAVSPSGQFKDPDVAVKSDPTVAVPGDVS